MGLRIDHIGIVVRDLDAAMATYAEVLSIPDSARTASTVRDPETGEDIDVGFLRIGDNRIEFICPRAGSQSRFAEHLERKGEGVYHISVYVDEFAAAIDSLRTSGVQIDPLTVVMTPPAPMPDTPTDSVRAQNRVVEIAWLPTQLTCGVNVELVDAHPSTRPGAS